MRKIFVITILAMFSSGVMAFDIFALGTSNTNCKGVERSRIFTAYLEEILRSDGMDVRVINGGEDGDRPVWMENRLHAGITEKTRIVIFEPGPNDRNKPTNVGYSEKILLTLQNLNMPTIYVSDKLIQSVEEGEATARKFGAYYYGDVHMGIPKDRVHRQFDMGNGGGHMTAEGCQLWAKNMAPLVKRVVGEKHIQ